MRWWGQKEVGKFWRYWKTELTKMPFCSPERESVSCQGAEWLWQVEEGRRGMVGQ